jgi:WD40 repeat protein
LLCTANETVQQLDVPGRGSMTLPRSQSLRVWDVPEARTVRKLPLPDVLGVAGALAPDGRALAVLEGHRLTVWETASGKARLQIRNLPPQATNMGPLGVAFSPDGRLLAAANRSRVVCVWNAAGKEVARFVGHQGPVHTVAFTPDGRGLITGSADTTALTWEVSPSDRTTTKLPPLP